ARALLRSAAAAAQTDASASPSAALAARVAALTEGFRGSVSLYARNLDTGSEFGVGADVPVRTASTIKLPIACTVAMLVKRGKASWEESLLLREQDKVSGSGVAADLSAGKTLSLRDATMLMITVSDNTTTNLILDRISADAVNDYMDELGLPITRSMRKVRGDGTQLKPAEGWSRAGLIEANKRFGIGSSTPREMVTLLTLLAQGKVVDAESSRIVLDMLERQKYKDGIGRRMGEARVLSKSGGLDALRSDVGIVDTPHGRVVLAITVDDLPEIDYSPDNPGLRLIADLAEVLVESLR
ncbi:MAG: serine hydrolase, partial [Nevskiaceae bacterium]